MRYRVPAVIVGLLVGSWLATSPPVAFAGKEPQVGSQLEFGVDMARRGLWNEALFRFQRAHRERPSDGQILNNIAVCYEALGLFEQALETYREALDSGSANRDLRNNYSRFLEFYQSFKPQEEVDAEEVDGDGDAADGDAMAAESEEESSDG